MTSTVRRTATTLFAAILMGCALLGCGRPPASESSTNAVEAPAPTADEPAATAQQVTPAATGASPTSTQAAALRPGPSAATQQFRFGRWLVQWPTGWRISTSGAADATVPSNPETPRIAHLQLRADGTRQSDVATIAHLSTTAPSALAGANRARAIEDLLRHWPAAAGQSQASVQRQQLAPAHTLWVALIQERNVQLRYVHEHANSNTLLVVDIQTRRDPSSARTHFDPILTRTVLRAANP